jgi:hypothetical protein
VFGGAAGHHERTIATGAGHIHITAPDDGSCSSATSPRRISTAASILPDRPTSAESGSSPTCSQHQSAVSSARARRAPHRQPRRRRVGRSLGRTVSGAGAESSPRPPLTLKARAGGGPIRAFRILHSRACSWTWSCTDRPARPTLTVSASRGRHRTILGTPADSVRRSRATPYFEPRQVETALARSSTEVEVTRGPDARGAIRPYSGTFLESTSESRMKADPHRSSRRTRTNRRVPP